MIPVVQLPLLVERYAPWFRDLFSPAQYEHFKRYLSGLIVGENKTIEGINRLFISDIRHPSSLNRFLTENEYDVEQLNIRRLSWLQECSQTRFQTGRPSQRGCLIVDDTLLTHVGNHFEGIAWLYDHVEERYVWAHNLVTLHYSDDEVDYPVSFQLWKPAQVTELEEALLAAGVRIQDRKRVLREEAPDKWRAYLLYLAGKNQDKEEVQRAYRSKLTIAQQLLEQFHKNYGGLNLPVVFDSWYTAPWFCRWLDREQGQPYVGTLTPQDEVFRQANEFTSLDDFAAQLKERHLANPDLGLFEEITFHYKGQPLTYYSYHGTHSIKKFGSHQLLISFKNADLSDEKPGFYICNRSKWDANTIIRMRRHRWPIEVYHQEGKSEGLDQYQLRDFEAIKKHIAFIALVYSMLQRARFDAELVTKLQQALDQEIQGSLAFWRRAFRAHALILLIDWFRQALQQGQAVEHILKPVIKAMAYSA